MELHSHRPKRQATGRSCALHPDPATAEAIRQALVFAAAALDAGRLLSPGEAMAIAGAEAREKDTLFSIAQKTALETGTDQSEILCRLGERYPMYA